MTSSKACLSSLAQVNKIKFESLKPYLHKSDSSYVFLLVLEHLVCFLYGSCVIQNESYYQGLFLRCKFNRHCCYYIASCFDILFGNMIPLIPIMPHFVSIEARDNEKNIRWNYHNGSSYCLVLGKCVSFMRGLYARKRKLQKRKKTHWMLYGYNNVKFILCYAMFVQLVSRKNDECGNVPFDHKLFL